MNLDQAKEQIAKENKFNDWIELVNESDDIIVFSKFEDAVNLVLFSKDKEIAELKEKLSEANNSLKYASEDAMEYKDKITHLKEMWKQCSDREIRITDILRSEIKTLESELSQLNKAYKELQDYSNKQSDKITFLNKSEFRYSEQIQSLQEEQIATKKLLVESVANNFHKENEINELHDEIKKKEEALKEIVTEVVEFYKSNPIIAEKYWLEITQLEKFLS